MTQRIMKIIIWIVGAAALAVFTLHALHGQGAHYASHGDHNMHMNQGEAHNKTTNPAPRAVKAFSARLTISLGHIASAGTSLPVPTGISCTKAKPATCHGEINCSGAASAQKGVCAFIERAPSLFTPLRGVACTEIYGGPETAHITGQVDGRAVDFKITRADGCQIGLWSMHEALWR